MRHIFLKDTVRLIQDEEEEYLDLILETCGVSDFKEMTSLRFECALCVEKFCSGKM